jgi:hypothetical protein
MAAFSSRCHLAASAANAPKLTAITLLFPLLLTAGTYWTSLDNFVARDPAVSSAFRAALAKAGAVSTLGATNPPKTLLVPANAAFKAAGPAVANADAKQVATVLR